MDAANEPLPVDRHVYRGSGNPGTVEELPSPPWRRFSGEPVNAVPSDASGETDRRIGGAHGVTRVPNPHEIAMVNAAIYLRRPLLVTGRPGAGKSSLGCLISRKLGLGPVLRWSITSRTTLKEGRQATSRDVRAYQPDHDWQELLTAIWHPLSSSITET